MIFWRRTFLRIPVICVLIGCLLPLYHTPGVADPYWRTSVGVFAPFDIPAGVNANAGWTVAVEYTFSAELEAGRQWSGVFRYAHYPLGGGQSINLYTPTLDLRQYLGSTRNGDSPEGWWIGGGLGMLFGDNTAGGHVWHFAYTTAVGYDARRLFIEARMVRGTKPGDHGFTASLGWKW